MASTEYHKINTVYKRDPDTHYKTLMEGYYSRPEFELLRNVDWLFTEKVDGTNIRVEYHGSASALTIRGRTSKSTIPVPLETAIWHVFDDQCGSVLSRLFEDKSVVFYGEGYGAGIQRNGHYYRATPSFVLFDVLVDGVFLNRSMVEDVAEKLHLSIVPIIGQGTLIEMVALAQNGIWSSWGDFEAEGIVARPKIELRTRDNKRIICKIKTKDFSQSAQEDQALKTKGSDHENATFIE